ncbi:hypothetical protein BKA62DRAFT_749495 [Auriculariales sp. MPI-PUGE-AT-0066]|nr:hypothetical protein BKA62DRAFT_749495 [Auriculariales sp. MPI-PUGE-AT-0066]
MNSGSEFTCGEQASTVSPSPDRPVHSRQASSRSDNYPSWLPRRPPVPVPRSTIHSSFGHYIDDPHNDTYEDDHRAHAHGHGRRATQRSVRIISMPGDELDSVSRREPTDTTRVAVPGPAFGHARAYSRATGITLTPNALSSSPLLATPRPRFNEPNLHIELLRSPSSLMHILFWLNRFFAFAHIPVQTFFDFNTAFVLFQAAKHPNPTSRGVQGSGRGWTFAFAAYIACYFLWILVVVLLYEVLYSFYRRWRTKRPYMLSIYLSAPAFNLASMASYNYFSFLWHIRLGAFYGDDAHARDAAAETCYILAQNWPTIVLLLPRAALSLAMLLTFSASNPLVLVSGRHLLSPDGSLTGYARGVLIANCAWAAWRAFVVLVSLLGLWALSGMACGGLCGPRFRWEEDRHEKFMHTDAAEEEADAIPWSWRECTRLRIQDAHDFCMTTRPSHPSKQKPPTEDDEPFEGIERVMAVAGFPQQPPPARRAVLTQDLFSAPAPPTAPMSGQLVPPSEAARDRRESAHAPLKNLPYPFEGYSTVPSSAGQAIPFPTPAPAAVPRPSTDTGYTGTGTGDVTDMTGTEDIHETEDMEDDDQDFTHESGELEGVEDDYDGEEMSPDGRTSGSMSSLGQPLPMTTTARYPFAFGRPSRAASAATRTTATQSRQSQSASSHVGSGSYASHSESPLSHEYTSSSGSHNVRTTGLAMIMPPPPRHPNPRARPRPSSQQAAGSSPSVVSGSAGDPAPERQYESEYDVEGEWSGSMDPADMSGPDVYDDSQLLSPELRLGGRSRGSRTNSHSSGVSGGDRSRTHSLIDSARSMSELGELVRGARSRSQSRAGTGSGPSAGYRSSPSASASSRSGSNGGHSSGSGSGPGAGAGQEHTFGMRSRFISHDSAASAIAATERLQALPAIPGSVSLRSSPSAPSIASATQSMATARATPPSPTDAVMTAPADVPEVPSRFAVAPSLPDLSSANPSFVTVNTGGSTTGGSAETYGVGHGHMHGAHHHDAARSAASQFHHPPEGGNFGQH